jgi:hypothetical protein
MIVNRNDYRMIDAQQGYGVGFQILSNSCFDPDEIRFATGLARLPQRNSTEMG